MSTRLPESRCTNCGKLCDAATGVGHKDRPSPGDVTICIGCGHLMAYDEQLAVRNLTDAEVVECAGDPRIIKAQALIAAVRIEKMHSLIKR